MGKFNPNSLKKNKDKEIETEKEKADKPKDKNPKGKSKDGKGKSEEGNEKGASATGTDAKQIVMGIDSIDLDNYVSPDPLHVAEMLKADERVELTAVKEVREKNKHKLKEENIDGPYCLCRKSIEGFMIRCNLCFEWFHSSCIVIPKTADGKPIGKGHTAWSANREVRYLCSLCSRSRRPKLDTILSLLMSLQKLPVRIPEGEALQFLTERAMNWQDRAKKALSCPEIQLVMNKVKLCAEKISSDKPNISNNIVQAVLMHQLLRVRKAEIKVEPEVKEELITDTTENDLKLEQSTVLECTEEMGGSPDTVKVLQEVDNYGSVNHPNITQLQNAESSRPQSPIDVCAPLQNDNSLQKEQYAFSETITMPPLPKSLLEALEQLMLEGDLLEVGLDEAFHIWAILQIQQPLAKEDCMIMVCSIQYSIILIICFFTNQECSRVNDIMIHFIIF